MKKLNLRKLLAVGALSACMAVCSVGAFMGLDTSNVLAATKTVAISEVANVFETSVGASVTQGTREMVTLTYNKNNPTSYSGLILKGGVGAKFTLKNPIDLTGGKWVGAKNAGNVPLIEFAVAPDNNKRLTTDGSNNNKGIDNEFGSGVLALKFTLTDAENASSQIVIDILTMHPNDDGYNYTGSKISASATGQTAGATTANGDQYTGFASGAQVFGIGFTGNVLSDLVYDYETNALYTSLGRATRKNYLIRSFGDFENTANNPGKTKSYADTDSPVTFSGKFNLTIEFPTVQEASAHVVVTNIAGVDLTGAETTFDGDATYFAESASAVAGTAVNLNDNFQQVIKFYNFNATATKIEVYDEADSALQGTAENGMYTPNAEGTYTVRYYYNESEYVKNTLEVKPLTISGDFAEGAVLYSTDGVTFANIARGATISPNGFIKFVPSGKVNAFSEKNDKVENGCGALDFDTVRTVRIEDTDYVATINGTTATKPISANEAIAISTFNVTDADLTITGLTFDKVSELHIREMDEDTYTHKASMWASEEFDMSTLYGSGISKSSNSNVTENNDGSYTVNIGYVKPFNHNGAYHANNQVFFRFDDKINDATQMATTKSYYWGTNPQLYIDIISLTVIPEYQIKVTGNDETSGLRLVAYFKQSELERLKSCKLIQDYSDFKLKGFVTAKDVLNNVDASYVNGMTYSQWTDTSKLTDYTGQTGPATSAGYITKEKSMREWVEVKQGYKEEHVGYAIDVVQLLNKNLNLEYAFQFALNVKYVAHTSEYGMLTNAPITFKVSDKIKSVLEKSLSDGATTEKKQAIELTINGETKTKYTSFSVEEVQWLCEKLTAAGDAGGYSASKA